MPRSRRRLLWATCATSHAIRAFDLFLSRLPALSWLVAGLYAYALFETSVATLATIQQDAAPNCNQSPVLQRPTLLS